MPDGQGGWSQETQTFGTTTAELLTLADWPQYLVRDDCESLERSSCPPAGIMPPGAAQTRPTPRKRSKRVDRPQDMAVSSGARHGWVAS